MRIEIDVDRCEGHGMCEEQAPAVFELDDEGTVMDKFGGGELPAELEQAAERGVAVCPVAALRIVR